MYFYFKPSQMFSIIAPACFSSLPILSFLAPKTVKYSPKCVFFPKGSLDINYELHVNIYYFPRSYLLRIWPMSLLPDILSIGINSVEAGEACEETKSLAQIQQGTNR